MTLPASGPLTITQILAEIGDSFPVTIPNANWRTLAGKPTGPLIIPNDFWGKSWRSIALTHTSTSRNETAQFGADATGRWIVVLAIAGDNMNPYSMAVTVAGSPATAIVQHSSGSGAGAATGTGIFVAQPSGTSGNVTVTTAGDDPHFYVLRVTGYNMGVAVFTDDSLGAGIPPWSVNVPANGLTLSLIQNRFGDPISWSGLTERIADNVLIPQHLNSAAWDINMAADPAKVIDVTASDVQGDTSAVIATFNPS